MFARGAEGVDLPDEGEVAAYRRVRQTHFDEESAQAFFWIDEIYGYDDELKALAFRDSDRDTVPDFSVSDFFGKFREGDVDVDGDGIRNLYDGFPFDASRGGVSESNDGVPVSGFEDVNENGLFDAVDWSLNGRDPALARIQLELFRDHKILLVERDSAFDLDLALAVDDTVRRVFRAYFEENDVMPSLRTIAAERKELLNPVLGAREEDTSAQVFRHSQSLIVYDLAREGALLELLGTLVHEVGHAYHLSLDFDADHLVEENGRLDLPSENFVKWLAPFGWTKAGWEDGFLGGTLPIVPRFLYIGTSGPTFHFWGESPEAWSEWSLKQFEALGEDPDYLSRGEYAEYGIVGEYSLTDPGEWYGDNLIAYVVSVLEEEALAKIDDDGSVVAARDRVDNALREIWPDFYHRNIDGDVRSYMEATFPVSEADRKVLAERYIGPILEPET